MVKIDIVDIIEGLYNVENSNTFIENYLKNESMFDTENPANKRVREVDESFSQYSNNYPQNDCGNVDNLFLGGLYNDSYGNNMTDIDKGAILQEFGRNIEGAEDLSSIRKNIVEKYIKSSETVVNTGVTGGYVHNTVDNCSQMLKTTILLTILTLWKKILINFKKYVRLKMTLCHNL